MQSALSRKILDDIISNENIITSQGIIRKKDDDIEVKKTSLKYHNIGLAEFKNHFVEIMEFYKTKRKQKADLIDSLIDDRYKVWTSKIPVYSTALRPSATNAENFYFTSVDKQINPLTAISINLKKATDIEVPLYLYQAQMRANELWNINFAMIDGKSGFTIVSPCSFNCRDDS